MKESFVVRVLVTTKRFHIYKNRNHHNILLTNFFPLDSQAENFERVSPNTNGNVTPRAMQFDVLLTKDPANGLGLTLVDGNLNGVPGVYVKLVADNGAGMKAVSF